ncbi:glycosyltransferase family 2 protein [Aquimarina sp. 2201CG5-10]|uniref:glycosyltransferase family 2 protein n=1 Tax=Aquimarina callyspongiae TaxID=3098150 RepID=UPI002AB4E4D3|nr:glycosyltransferase family 2 protein [Aquimarina sp. 2201CG5-10]MDY8138646.1 glycosyltransferase family 2 protein [Aquimarina sp. 2201CG5-10]
MLKRLTIVIPAYNEAESLGLFFPEVMEHCIDKEYDLIIVNDGSSDETLQILEKFQKESEFDFRIISHKLNKGYGGALKSGIEASETDFVITIDADGQHYLEDVDKLFSKILETDADLIVGSRKGQASASVFRGIGKRIIRIVAKMLMKLSVHDINSGMKIYNTGLVKRYLKLTPDTMSFSDIITLTFVNNRHLVIEEPIKIKDRLKGKSTIGVRTAFETVMEIINIIILFNPARIFLPISAFFFVFGVAWGANFFFQGKGISIGASTLILTGLIIFLLGLIAEQLSAVRKNQ